MFLQQNTFTVRTFLMNAYSSKGVMKETGRPYDSTTLWVMCPHKNGNGSMGLGYELLKWGTSDNYERIKHINLLSTGPVEVELELETIRAGQGDKERTEKVVHNLKLVRPSDLKPSKASDEKAT